MSKFSVENYCDQVTERFQLLKLKSDVLIKAADLLKETQQTGGKILVCGNGGSAADAQHFAAELVGRYKRERQAIAAIALTTDTSIITAVANDYDYDQVFARQIEALGNKGDTLIAISTSGNSGNVVKAAEKAKVKGLNVISLTGQAGGQLKDNVDIWLGVPSGETNHIQEMHIAIIHMLCGMIEADLD